VVTVDQMQVHFRRELIRLARRQPLATADEADDAFDQIAMREEEIRVTPGVGTSHRRTT
jgi:hypothetical protein